jgi:hypothetical protein
MTYKELVFEGLDDFEVSGIVKEKTCKAVVTVESKQPGVKNKIGLKVQISPGIFKKYFQNPYLIMVDYFNCLTLKKQGFPQK